MIPYGHRYQEFDDWFHELEKTSYRSERFFETIDNPKNADIIKWLKAAFESGREMKNVR
jgi:hypothetical protein